MTVRRVWLGAGLECALNPGGGHEAEAFYRPLFMTASLCHDLRKGDQQVSKILRAIRWKSHWSKRRSGSSLRFQTGRSSTDPFRREPHAAIDGACDSSGPDALLQGRAGDGRPAVRPNPGRRRNTSVGFRLAHQSSPRAGSDGRARPAGHRDVLPAARGPLAARQGGRRSHLRRTGRSGRSTSPEVPEALRKCREAGIAVIMVTGDHPFTARAIGRGIGLIRSETPLSPIVTGEELRVLTDTQLRLAFDLPEIIFAQVGADQKRRIVEALKRKGQPARAATGDGVNDAPALKRAHIGIAVGIAGTDVAKEAADMMLLDDNFASIVNAVEEGRAVFSNIRKFLTYILAHNVPELIPYLVFSLLSVPLALTPIQILSIDMGTDSLTALGLGVEKPDPRMMQRPPRSQHQRLFDWPLALRAYLFLGAIEAAITMAAFFFVLHGGGWRYGHALAMRDPLSLRATTACFSVIVVLQIVNVFLCRNSTRSIFSTGILGNPLIWGGVIVEIALTVLIGYTPVGNSIFATAPINAKQWLFILPFAAVMLVAEEVRKWIVRASWRT